jgi:CheY-like chemotaxis protein
MIPRQHIQLLCVDDEVRVLDWLKVVLDARGYIVEVAQNGFTALAKITKDPQQFQLIVTDLRMPGMDGFSLIEQSRMAGYDGRFLVYAASISPEAWQRLRELHVAAVVEKPVLAGQLADAVKQLLSGF